MVMSVVGRNKLKCALTLTADHALLSSCVIARPRSIRMEALLCLQQVGLELLGVVAGMTTKTKTSQQGVRQVVD